MRSRSRRRRMTDAQHSSAGGRFNDFVAAGTDDGITLSQKQTFEFTPFNRRPTHVDAISGRSLDARSTETSPAGVKSTDK
jgi:hypothetical protein